MGDCINEYFRQVYDLTYQSIFRFAVVRCLSVSDVEDLLQSVYVNFLKHIRSKGILSVNNPKAFVFKIARNEMNAYYKEQKRLRSQAHVFSDLEEGLDEIPDNVNIEELMDNLLLTEQIWNELSEDPKVAQIFTLYFLDDMKLRDIGRVMELSESTVKSKLYRELRRLKEKLGEGDECEYQRAE